MNEYGRAIHPKATSRISMRSGFPKDYVEDKGDALAGKLADLNLLIRKTTTPVDTKSDNLSLKKG